MKKKSIAIILAMGLIALTACSSSDPIKSGLVTTTEIFPIMKAVQNVDGSVITTVELHNFSGTFLYTSFGDNLYSSLDVAPESYKNIETDLFSNAKNYSTNVKKLDSRYIYRNYGIFSTQNNSASEYFASQSLDNSSTPTRSYVSFERAENNDATNSWVEFPPSFTITNPSASSSISRANGPLTVTWSDPDNLTMNLDVAVLCGTARWEYSVAISAQNTGSHVLNSSDYFPVASAEVNSTCNIAFVLRRSQAGVVSASFGGGTFTGIQQRIVQFTSTP